MTTANDQSASAIPLLAEGLERHVTPAGDGHGIVTKKSSDEIFGPDGLGFGATIWTSLISWLARNGISKQTGSNPNETNIKNCVLGWGQGAFSSHVFDKDKGIDQAQLGRLVSHLQGIASEFGDKKRAITSPVLAAYVGSQKACPFLTVDGIVQVRGIGERLGSRFRSHIQWQALWTLCGQVTVDGRKQVTPELLTHFFTSEKPLFADIVERRRLLHSGTLKPGERKGPLGDTPAEVDLERTDREYMKRKSGLWMVTKIAFYMITRKASKGPSLSGGSGN